MANDQVVKKTFDSIVKDTRERGRLRKEKNAVTELFRAMGISDRMPQGSLFTVCNEEVLRVRVV